MFLFDFVLADDLDLLLVLGLLGLDDEFLFGEFADVAL